MKHYSAVWWIFHEIVVVTFLFTMNTLTCLQCLQWEQNWTWDKKIAISSQWINDCNFALFAYSYFFIKFICHYVIYWWQFVEITSISVHFAISLIVTKFIIDCNSELILQHFYFNKITFVLFRRKFEQLALMFDEFTKLIPLTFLLGFYVSNVVSRSEF